MSRLEIDASCANVILTDHWILARPGRESHAHPSSHRTPLAYEQPGDNLPEVKLVPIHIRPPFSPLIVTAMLVLGVLTHKAGWTTMSYLVLAAAGAATTAWIFHLWQIKKANSVAKAVVEELTKGPQHFGEAIQGITGIWGRYRRASLLKAYAAYIPTILVQHERAYFDEELAVAKQLESLVDPIGRKAVNTFYYVSLLKNVLADRVLTEDEDGEMRDYARTLEVDEEILREAEKVIGYFRELSRLEKTALHPIETKLPVTGPVYADMPAKRYMYRTTSLGLHGSSWRSRTKLVPDDEGRLALTREALVLATRERQAEHRLQHLVEARITRDFEVVEFDFISSTTTLSTPSNLQMLAVLRRLLPQSVAAGPIGKWSKVVSPTFNEPAPDLSAAESGTVTPAGHHRRHSDTPTETHSD